MQDAGEAIGTALAPVLAALQGGVPGSERIQLHSNNPAAGCHHRDLGPRAGRPSGAGCGCSRPPSRHRSTSAPLA